MPTIYFILLPNKHYEQTCGVVIDLRLSPIMASLFMEFREKST